MNLSSWMQTVDARKIKNSKGARSKLKYVPSACNDDIGASKNGVDDAFKKAAKNKVAQIMSVGGDSDGIDGNFHKDAEVVKSTVAQNIVDSVIFGGTSGDVQNFLVKCQKNAAETNVKNLPCDLGDDELNSKRNCVNHNNFKRRTWID